MAGEVSNPCNYLRVSMADSNKLGQEALTGLASVSHCRHVHRALWDLKVRMVV